MTQNPAKTAKNNPMEADGFERMEAELDNIIFDEIACIFGNPDCPKCKKPDVTNHDFAVGMDLATPGSDRTVLAIARVREWTGEGFGGFRSCGFDVQTTYFYDGHEITIPKRMEPDEAARYAATNDLF